MSETQGAPAPVVPPPLPTLTTPTPPVVAAPTAPPLPAPEPDAKWIAERLERHEKQVLAKLGFKDEADAKAAAEARKASEEAAKTTEQKRVEAERRAKELEGQVTERDELIAKMAASKTAALTDGQRAALEAIAGDDPLLQLSLLEFGAAFAAGATPGTQTPAAPRPAQTAAPAPPAPAPGTPKTDFEKWNDLKTTDPVAASLFYQLNSMRIEQSRRT